MSKKILLYILFGILFSVNVAYGEECLRYEPEKVRFKGTIVRKTFPGPPEYESVEQGDKPETVWILNLLKPVCVLADEDDDLNETEKDVRAIHLVLDDKQYKKYRHLVSKKVVAIGTLYSSYTGHHRTSVLMRVISIDKIR